MHHRCHRRPFSIVFSHRPETNCTFTPFVAHLNYLSFFFLFFEIIYLLFYYFVFFPKKKQQHPFLSLICSLFLSIRMFEFEKNNTKQSTDDDDDDEINVIFYFC